MWYSPAPNPRSLETPYPGTPTTLRSRRVVENLLQDSVPGMPYQAPVEMPWPMVSPNPVYNEHPPNGGVLPYGLGPAHRGHVSYDPQPGFETSYSPADPSGVERIPIASFSGLGAAKKEESYLPWGWIGLTAALVAFGYWRKKR